MAKISQSFNAPVVLACFLFCSLKEKKKERKKTNVTQTRGGKGAPRRAGVPSARPCRGAVEGDAGSVVRVPGPPEEPLRFCWCRRPAGSVNNVAIGHTKRIRFWTLQVHGETPISTSNTCFSCQMPSSLFLGSVCTEKKNPEKYDRLHHCSKEKNALIEYQTHRNERGNRKIVTTDTLLLSCTFGHLFIDVKQDMAHGWCSAHTPP